MMFRRTLLASALVLASASAFAAPQTYTLDASHTDVLFSWNHFGFSNPTGHFGNVDGTLVFDEQDPAASSVQVTLPLDGLDTHVPKLDEHLKKADFLDAAQFPTITFKSTSVKAGATKGHYSVTGDLTVHGVTKSVVLDAKLNKIGEHPMRKVPAIGFDATTSFKRSDFGVGAFVPNVGDEIGVRITTEALAAEKK